MLSDMELKRPEQAADRREQLMSIIRERFSCEEMSKRALGNEWVKRSEAEQQGFSAMEKAGHWLVYDVVVDGISLMSSYRGQFARVLTYASYETLVERMREKADLPMHARASEVLYVSGYRTPRLPVSRRSALRSRSCPLGASSPPQQLISDLSKVDQIRSIQKSSIELRP